jgi:Polysulfide reductase
MSVETGDRGRAPSDAAPRQWQIPVYVFTEGVAGLSPALGLAARAVGNARLARATEAVAALLGPVLASYTGVLVADTAVPVWHEGRRELPFVFAGSGAASAGATALLLVPPGEARPARRLLLFGAALEGVGMQVMQRRLGFVGEPYRQGRAGRLARLAQGLTTTGATVTGFLGRRRAAAAVGGALVLAGELSLRWAIFEAGFQSARDPRYTVAPQRARVDERSR